MRKIPVFASDDEEMVWVWMARDVIFEWTTMLENHEIIDYAKMKQSGHDAYTIAGERQMLAVRMAELFLKSRNLSQE